MDDQYDAGEMAAVLDTLDADRWADDGGPVPDDGPGGRSTRWVPGWLLRSARSEFPRHDD